jgi:peptidoglycan/xylan/chitin deacetylase (PgdA/CDA1 family)
MALSRPSDFTSAQEQSGRHSPKLYFLYHALSEDRSRYSYTLAAEQFQAHVSLFVEARKAGPSCFWPEVTFDDGHASNLNLALPILEANSLTATFFITVGWTGRKPGYLGWSDLRALHDSGQQIGAHGWSHAFLTECNGDELKHELLASRLMLEDKLGTEISTMALPGGRYNRRVVAACEAAGYHRVFTSVPEAEKLSSSFLVGRVNARSEMTIKDLRELMRPGSRALRRLKRLYLAKGITKRLLTNRLYDRLWWTLAKNVGDQETTLEADEDSARYQ